MRRLGAALLWVALLLRAPAAFGEPVLVRLLHVNDFHGFAEPEFDRRSGKLLGGLAHLAARVRALRSEGPSLLLAAGDMIQGNSWSDLTRGASVIDAMNALAFDAMVLGNHEFDFGPAVLKARIEEARFPVLAANVDGVPGVKPYALLSAGGVRIAVIGVLTERTRIETHPDNVKGVDFFRPAGAVRRVLEALRGKADVFVVLSHLGHGPDLKLAQDVAGIDVILGGHTHTRLDEPVRVGRTLICQAWEHGKVLGVVDLTVDSGKLLRAEGRLEEIRPTPEGGDPELRELVQRHVRAAEATLGETLAVAGEDLDAEAGRRRETALGDLVADAVRRSARADIALVNGGGIRASLRKGPLRLKDLYDALPFENYVVTLELTGSEVKKALEHGVSGVAEGEGRFPQVSGLRFTWSPSAPKGKRVRQVYVGESRLEPERRYRVATNDFLAAGGDGYRVFAEARKPDEAPGRRVREVVAESFREAKTLLPPPRGRIVEAGP
ncbi:MAG: 5'-nucleotidase C-terminal domain-containing protein [Deltaproteobacteria bacterium]|nr:5'-nucleotidase C-terminal domain-containing protein [Deltaproteobacteria bacterium]